MRLTALIHVKRASFSLLNQQMNKGCLANNCQVGDDAHNWLFADAFDPRQCKGCRRRDSVAEDSRGVTPRPMHRREIAMAYKSLLTVVTDPATVTHTLAAAIALARREDAHLDVLCVGVDNSQVGYYYPGSVAVILQDEIERAEQDAATLADLVNTHLINEGLRWSSETAIAYLGAVSDLIAGRARYADLVILPKPYGKNASVYAETVLEAALFQGQTPVLVVPTAGLPVTLGNMTLGQEIVVAWNQSSEALVAVRSALPLLCAAKHVTIAIIDPPTRSFERSDPGGALAQLLARHGVHAEVTVLAKTLPRVTDVLNRLIRDKAADLLVMGAYGHSRFREAVLGGATRDMLELAEIPVLMAR
ncbi:MAG: universal stress protein [Cypionkella sp.]|nr:universal stress protein [Cypionkella sp.]